MLGIAWPQVGSEGDQCAAIVVGVSITGVALALLLRIYNRYGTLEEDELLERIGG